MLGQVLDHLKRSGVKVVPFAKLDKLMQNSEIPQFGYEAFKAAYDSNQSIKNIVTNFDREKIELKQSEMDDLPNGKKKDSDAVSKMAKRAVDI
jgi:hypothetical protein